WFWPPNQPNITRLVADLGLASLAQIDDGCLLHLSDPNQPPQTVALTAQPAPDPDASEDATPGAVHGGARRVAGGTGAVIQALARPLPSERLCLGQRLVAVIDRGDHVELHLRRGDESDPVTVLARRLVLALPPRVLDATVSFEPELPAATRQAMVATATWMACAAKAGFVYPHAFWRDNGHTGNAWVSHRQAMLGQVFDACGPIAEQADARQGAALAGFAAMRAAQRPGFALSRDLLLLSQMVQLFGPQADDAAQPPELFWHDWATEPETCSPADLADDARGAGAHPHYGDPALGLPLWGGRVFLAGTETASQGGGYLEGALVAAARVRRQLAALNDA
ncbi:MAG: hypothetical protein RL375_2570, partial [Pseudomonadota bacterium]